jgi:hypothetical protein
MEPDPRRIDHREAVRGQWQGFAAVTERGAWVTFMGTL